MFYLFKMINCEKIVYLSNRLLSVVTVIVLIIFYFPLILKDVSMEVIFLQFAVFQSWETQIVQAILKLA